MNIAEAWVAIKNLDCHGTGDKRGFVVYALHAEAAARDAMLAAFDLVAAVWEPECPGCGERHATGHGDSCACDHCAWVSANRGQIAALT